MRAQDLVYLLQTRADPDDEVVFVRYISKKNALEEHVFPSSNDITDIWKDREISEDAILIRVPEAE